MLSDSLEDLEDKTLVNRPIISEKPFRVQYSLTDCGESVEPVIYEMRAWGIEQPAPADDRSSSRF